MCRKQNNLRETVHHHLERVRLESFKRGSKLVDEMIEWMKGLYGQCMGISRGKKHDYLGIMIDFSVRGQVALTMVDYLKGLIYDFEEVEILTGNAASPAVEHLYAIIEDNYKDKLDEKRFMAFQHAVTQLLFVCPRARKDIQTTVSFLTKRVQSPDKDGQVKLKRALRFVQRTINPALILRSDSLSVIKWWVDPSCAAHPDMRG